jgi:hypothetical protein
VGKNPNGKSWITWDIVVAIVVRFRNVQFSQIMKTILLASRSALILLAFPLLLVRSASAVPATPGYALQLDGSTGYVTTFGVFSDPQDFTISVWFNTTTTQGGKLVGFGDVSTGPSGNYDRHLYMDNQGHVVFGVNPGSIEIISNTVACNDGNWHQAVATLAFSTGMSLYIDGVLATNQAAFNSAQHFNGVWKIGYDNLNNWPDQPASFFFKGTIDEVQIWETPLNASQIQTNLHLFRAGTETYLYSYWHFDEGSGATTTDNSGHVNTGHLEGGATWVTSTAPIGLPQVTNQAASSITASVAVFNGVALPNYQQTGAWFQYGATTNYTFTSLQTAISPNNSSPVSVNQNISGLQQGTLYHYQLVASNSAGTNFGSDLTFTTLSNAQYLLPVTMAATKLSASSVTLNGSLNPNGFDTKAWFEWGSTVICGNSTPTTDLGSGTNAVTITARLFGLQGGQLYYYHLAATNAFGKFIGVNHVLEVPLLGLYGDNPLTNCYGVPFVDPGYTLAPASPLAIAASDDDELGVEENDFGLALTGDGTVIGWGYNGNGETNIPAGLSNVVAIAAGDRSGLALETNGTVVGWGANGGEINIPAGLSNVVAIAAGGNNAFSLALKSDGTVVGWGGNNYGETSIPFGLGSVAAVAAGNNFSLALKSDGTVVNWGYNVNGGNTPPSGLSNVVAIAAGNSFSLALQSNGAVVGWGQNAYEEIPIPSGLTNAVGISVGGYFGMVLQNDGTIVGWGNNPASGGFQNSWDIAGNSRAIAGGLNSGLPAGFPAVQSTTLMSIAAGNDFSLALAGNGTVDGGGNNAYGNLNIPSGLNVSSAPITVSGTVNVNIPGVYTLVYTVTNFMGAVDTVTRTVVVTPPPPPTGITITNIATGQFALQFTGNANAGYSVLATTNVALPLADWTVLGSATSLPNNLFQYIDTKATNIPARFYLLRSP